MVIDKTSYILVTGAAGFIGSCFLRYLNDQGIDRIIAVDHLDQSDKWKNLVRKNFVEILDKSQLFTWLSSHASRIGAIVHLGACSSTVETNSSYLLENNYRYTLQLAQFAFDHSIRFVYAPSAATYGDGSLGFSDDESMISELRPLNMYGYSKQLFDLWVQRQGLFSHFVGLKFFNVFGPNEAHKGRMASAIVHMVRQIQNQGHVCLFKSNDPCHFADGEQCRDFIYVKDVVRIIYQLLYSDISGLFNVGRGQPSSWKSLATALFKALDQPVAIQFIDMPDDLKGKYQNYTCAQMDKLHSLLFDHTDCLSIEDAVQDYVKNYLLKDERW